jgi:uncharacterized membrane protein
MDNNETARGWRTWSAHARVRTTRLKHRAESASGAVDGGQRLAAVDTLRGLVMVTMALDHTRDFIHAGAMSFSPEDLAQTTPILFLTRWITHICAPTFMLLAGIGTFLRLHRDGRTDRLSRFLWTRGLWLVVLELTVMRLGMNFTLDPGNPLLVLVLSALGLSMIVMAALIYLPPRVLLVLSLTVIALHNLLDGVGATEFGPVAAVWNVLHQPGVFVLAGIPVVVGYPLIPWFAVMAAGFSLGPVLLMEPAKRRRVLLLTGGAMVVGFVLLRTANVYGDPVPWSRQGWAVMTALSFLRTTKYPPSLQFLLMTLGPALIALASMDRLGSHLANRLAVIGRVPLFFYVVHFWGLHLLAAVMAWVRYGRGSFAFLFHPLPSMGGARELFPPDFGYPLWVAYVVWAGVVLSLYPLCRWFAALKNRRRVWWTSYV